MRIILVINVLICIFWLFINLLSLVGGLVIDLDVYNYVLIIAMFSVIILQFFNKSRAKIVFLVYLLIVFLFNGSGFFFHAIGVYDFWSSVSIGSLGVIYSDDIKIETINSVGMFFSFLSLGFLTSSAIIQQNNRYIDGVELVNMQLRNFSFVLFIVVVPFAYYYYLTWSREAYLSGGYLGYVLNDAKKGTEDLPFIFRISDELFLISFWIYVATIPNVKNSIIASVIYFFPYFLLSISTGSRVHAASQALAIFLFFIIVYKVKFLKIAKYFILFVISMVAVGLLRARIDYDIEAALNLIEGSGEFYIVTLLKEIGGTAHTISLTINSIVGNVFNSSLRFMFDPLFNSTGYIQGKPESDYFYLADRLSYHYLDNFSYGAGMGSSIVAEFYVLFGILGVVICSFIYGFLINFNFSKVKSAFSLAFLFIILDGLLYTPRSHPLLLTSSNIIILFLLVYIFYNLVVRTHARR